MLKSIIRFSVENKLVIGLLTLALVIMGVYELGRLPIDAVPDITDNQVQVITQSPALGAPDIERLITFPVEQANSSIPGLKEIRSFSRFGLSLVTLVFTDETDVYWARQQVSERLQQVQSQLPEGLGTPELAPVTTGLGEIYQYVLRPAPGYEAQYGPMELRTIQDWVVRRQLLGVKGVADISSFGGMLKQYEVAVDSRKLNAYGLSIADVFNAISANNANTGGAYIEKGPTVLFIRTEGLVQNNEELGQIAIKNLPNGLPVLLRDVAEVRFGQANRYGAMTYNGNEEVSGGIVMMLKGGNSSEVIKLVKERITQIKGTLPEGVIIEPFLDRTKMVNNAIGTVETNLMEGALIVVFVLVLFLGHIRAGLIVASVIPLSMLFAVILMNLFGVSGNLMSLGALDFGLIVDGAVIIVEAIMHRLSHFRKEDEGRELRLDEFNHEVTGSASRMLNSAVFGQIIILIVYMPIFLFEGIEGKMFRPMAQTVAFALLGAFILSMTYVPMMSSLFLSRKLSSRKTFSDRMMEKLEMLFSSSLGRFLRRPVPVIVGAIVAFVLSMVLLAGMGGEFIPELEEGDLAVDTRVMTGSNLNTTIQATGETARMLLDSFPEVIKVVTKIGSGEIPTDPMPIEASDMMVILKDKKEWTSAKTFEELTAKMSDMLKSIPGVTTGFQYPVQMRFNELMTGARQDVVCKIFGEDLDTLTVYAARLGELVQSTEGAADLYVETMTGMPQIVIRYNRAALAQYGVSVAEVNKVVNTAFAGGISGQVFEGERRFDLVVRLSGQLRKNIDDVRNLLVPAHEGLHIPLYQVASVELKEGPNQIQREDAKRRITVGFNVRGRDVQSIVNELEKKVGSGLRLPPGYYVTYGGAFENLVEARKRLSIALPLALGLIFILLYFAFRSLGKGLLIFTAIPLSAIGGIVALWLRDMPFSISAGIGFIALFGVAVLNGIVLLSEFNRIEEEGEGDPERIVKSGTRNRLRPVLMTAAVASLGFLPMALSTGAGAEVQKPLATVVIGGLVSATFLTLILVPILYVHRQNWINCHKMRKSLPVILLMFISISASAQQSLPISAAIDSAMRNPLVERERLRADYYKAIRKSSWEPGATTLLGEYGQFNTAETDNKITISQEITLPFTSIRRSQMAREQESATRWRMEEAKLTLRERILRIYSDYFINAQELIVMERADSISRAMNDRSRRSLAAGAITGTESAYAEIQSGEQSARYHRGMSERNSLILELQSLLRTQSAYIPMAEGIDSFLSRIRVADTALLKRHPALMALQKEQEAAHVKRRLEQSQLWPVFSVGYFNQSLRGWQRIGNEEFFFDGSDRFDGVQVGLSFPLFVNFRLAKVKAMKIEELIAEKEHQAQSDALRLRLADILQAMQRLQPSREWYLEKGIPSSDIIEKDALRRLERGDIDYFQWSLLMNKALDIRLQYLHLEREWRYFQISYTTLTSN